MTIQEVSHPDLEYLVAYPPTQQGPPIILVHGAYQDARIWSRHFMPYFIELGHPVYALHLRSQTLSPSRKALFSFRLKDYVRRLGAMIGEVGASPILIGHSMGGLVVQLYLSQPTQAIPVKGACLLASLPPFGMKNTLWGMVRDPQTLLAYTVLTFSPKTAKKYPPPRGVMVEVMDEEMRERFQHLLVQESVRALWGCLSPQIDLEKVKEVPLLVLGASEDNLALPVDVKKMGQLYDTPAYIYPQTGHLMMVDRSWKKVAAHIEEELLAEVRS